MLAENVNKVKILKKFITTSDSIAPPYLHSFDDDLCKKLCFFFSKFLDTSNLETIQATYRLIVDELQSMFSNIFDYANSRICGIIFSSLNCLSCLICDYNMLFGRSI